MALLRLQNEANRLTLKPTKQSLKHQPSPTLNRSYPYRASGLVHGSISASVSDFADSMDILGRPRTLLDGGPWAIQTVPPVPVRVKLK